MLRSKKPHVIPRTRYQYGGLLFIICMVGYMFLYTGRGVLSTSIPSIVAEGIFTKQSLGAVGTVFFIVYGIMQTPMGMLADRVKPHIMITIGLTGSAVFTLLSGLFAGSFWIYVFWGLNGLMQACYWPSVVKTVAEIMPAEQRIRGSLSLALSGPIGALGLFVTSAIVFSITGWRTLFFVVAVLMAAMSIVTYFGLGKVCRYLKNSEKEDPILCEAAQVKQRNVPKVSAFKLLFRSGAVFLLMPCMTFGVIREGINMWSPTLLLEQYNVNPVQAMLLSTCLPIIAALAVPIAIFLLKKSNGSELKSSILCHALTVMTMGLVLFFGSSFGPVFCIVLLAVATAMQGVTSAITMAINAYFGKYNKTGTMIGLFNMATFTGNAIVSFLMGWVSQHFGWGSALWIWMVAAVVGLIFTMIGRPRWERFKKRTSSNPADIG